MAGCWHAVVLVFQGEFPLQHWPNGRTLQTTAGVCVPDGVTSFPPEFLLSRQQVAGLTEHNQMLMACVCLKGTCTDTLHCNWTSRCLPNFCCCLRWRNLTFYGTSKCRPRVCSVGCVSETHLHAAHFPCQLAATRSTAQRQQRVSLHTSAAGSSLPTPSLPSWAGRRGFWAQPAVDGQNMLDQHTRKLPRPRTRGRRNSSCTKKSKKRNLGAFYCT